MAEAFYTYEVQGPGGKIPAYLIESSAPINYGDDRDVQRADLPNLSPIDTDSAIDRIVDYLKTLKNPKLVVCIHGFNSPREKILPGYRNLFQSVYEDDYVKNNEVVSIGYRWPSERIGAPFGTTIEAAPSFFLSLIRFEIGILLLTLLLSFYIGLVVMTFFLAVSATVILLRGIVYFQDGYRATTIGVPDVVEIIRQIDKKLAEKDERRNFVGLSFIAHSMGTNVVPNVVRILASVFSPTSMRDGLSARPKNTRSDIGKMFRLKHLVLVSPDLPAAMLYSVQGNILAQALFRFEEVFLFSNEGDEVLRAISTTANYFLLPTSKREFGYRLGNVGVFVKNYGISRDVTLQKLRIGKLTLDHHIHRMGFGQHGLPKRFSYFDCTDCVETGKGVLTLARCGHENKLGRYAHLRLLFLYILKGKPDVHGGYFKSIFLKQLIYRLACIGLGETVQAYGGEDQLDHECQTRQIKVLLNS